MYRVQVDLAVEGLDGSLTKVSGGYQTNLEPPNFELGIAVL